ncbi:MAG: shikimate dehydrogenase, partial [Lachnospiraceae bacterium]|nr:shikimate dehydrogenase [Lachnospiraceae bacterium]
AEFMEKHDFKAINVTIPYKQTVIPYIDVLDDKAARIGAVNTVVNKDGKLYGYNTDFYGFLYMCNHNNVTIENKKVLIIGNGGAAAAIKAVVEHLNAAQYVVVDIVPADGVITYEECYAKHTDAEVIINTSPVGMYPKVDASPVDLEAFTKCEAVLDVVYNPLVTKLTAQAAQLGMQAVNGLEMLVAQAKYAVEYFLDTTIDDSVIDGIYKDIYNQKSNI